MEYLVTGATGFIGGHLARLLLERGHGVRAIVRSPPRAQGLVERGVQVYPGDITDRPSLRPAMLGVDGVFHVAGWYRIGVRDRATAIAVNVEGTRNVLETMRALRIPKGVYTSTLAVYSDTRGVLRDESFRYVGPWLTLYDETKWKAHYEVAEPMARDGLPLVTVLPGLVYGPGDTSPMHDVWLEYLSGRLRAVPKVTAYCFGHVEDTAEAHLQAMERGVPGQSYNISGPPHTLVEALEIARQATGIPAPKWHPSRSTLRMMAALTRNERYRVAGATYLGDNRKAVRELGFAPRSLEIGLPTTLESERRALSSGPTG